jgi:hypothetical protein
MQSVKVRIQAGGRSGWSGVPRLVGVVSVVALGLGVASATFAQIPSVLSGGPPVQVVPYVSEPGVPQVTITSGTANPFSGADGSGGSGTGGTDGSGGGTGGTDGSGGGTAGGNVGNSDALTTLLGTPWGSAAISNATALGVNPSAVAATCVLESGCQNVGGSSTVAGAFQMTASTYTAMINAAVAQNPSLANTIVPGLAGQMDPATESIAASEYLLQGAQYLQNQGVSDPSVLDVRGYYNFGPQGGAQIANASPDQTMASVLTGYSAATLASNGITPGETVGQWQAGVSAKIGNAATQSVLNS